MKEIRERLVDYELASMLKDAGFDVPVERVIYPDGTVMFIDQNSVSRDKHIELPNSKLNIWDTCVSAPTLDMACEWLLVEKGLFVAVFCSTDGRWFSYRLYSDKGEKFILIGDYGNEYKATNPVAARIMGLRNALMLELPMRDNGDRCLIKNDNTMKDNEKNFGEYSLAFNAEGKDGAPETVVIKRELQMDCKTVGNCTDERPNDEWIRRFIMASCGWLKKNSVGFVMEDEKGNEVMFNGCHLVDGDALAKAYREYFEKHWLNREVRK